MTTLHKLDWIPEYLPADRTLVFIFDAVNEVDLRFLPECAAKETGKRKKLLSSLTKALLGASSRKRLSLKSYLGSLITLATIVFSLINVADFKNFPETGP